MRRATGKNVTLEELIKLAIDFRLLDLHVAIPGKVEAFDGSTCKASVRPMVKRPVPTKTGGRRLETLPVIQNVRVSYAGGKGLAVAFPLEAGDTGTIIFCEAPIAEWGRTGENSDPGDLRRHTLSGAVFFPGLYTDGNKPTVASDGITLGKKDGTFVLKVKGDVVEIGGNSDAAARASLTNTQFNDLKTAISGWTPVPNDGGAALKVALATWYGTSAAVASTKLKLGG